MNTSLNRDKRNRTDRQLTVLVCPGFHDESLTESFVRSLPSFIAPRIVQTFPADPLATLAKIKQIFQSQPVVAIGFSAGVVGLVGALALWQQQDGKIERLFAIDGWGVPAMGLPICRLSHDAFTHWSSLPLGVGNANFYADPGVAHLQMWEAPKQVKGWEVGSGAIADLLAQSYRPAERPTEPLAERPITAADFLNTQLERCFRAVGNR